MKTFKSGLVCVTVLVCALSGACGGSSESGGGASGANQGGSVVVGFLSEPTTLNPLIATSSRELHIINLLFKKLMTEQADFISFAPGLARTWTFSDDSLTVTFQLREGLTWQDGAPLTAEDVRFTWELHTNPEIAWSGRHLKEHITGVEVLDPLTVAFHFDRRYPYQLMDINDGPILPRHLLAGVAPDAMRTAPFGKSPVGSGPFRLAHWEPARYLELERNPGYFEAGKPRLDRVLFRFVPDEATLVTQLEAGEIDCLESLSADAVAAIEARYPEVRIYRYKGRAMSFLAWNVRRAPFDDPALRRALAMGIDAKAIIEAVWHGMAEPATSPMHPILWAHDPSLQPIRFDPEAARRALDGLGWRDSDGDGVRDRGGVRLEFEANTNQGSQQRIDALTIVQAQLAAIGVRVDVRVLEWGAFMSKVVRESDFDACLFGYNVSTRADLKNYWSTGATFNLSGYSNAEVDTLIERARRAPDLESARRDWYRCQDIIYDDQPFYFLAIPLEVVGLNRKFCDVHPTAQGFYANLEEWYVGDCQP